MEIVTWFSMCGVQSRIFDLSGEGGNPLWGGEGITTGKMARGSGLTVCLSAQHCRGQVWGGQRGPRGWGAGTASPEGWRGGGHGFGPPWSRSIVCAHTRVCYEIWSLSNCLVLRTTFEKRSLIQFPTLQMNRSGYFVLETSAL